MRAGGEVEEMGRREGKEGIDDAHESCMENNVGLNSSGMCMVDDVAQDKKINMRLDIEGKQGRTKKWEKRMKGRGISASYETHAVAK